MHSTVKTLDKLKLKETEKSYEQTYCISNPIYKTNLLHTVSLLNKNNLF